MNAKYILCKETYQAGSNERIAYGIAAYAKNTKTCVVSLHDITSDKDALTRLVLLCNRLQLSPVHLYDVVEDFLAN